MKRLCIALSAIVLVASIFMALQPTTSAAFNRNRIIDDSVFNRSNSMNAAQIDAFLNARPNSCISPNSGFQAKVPSGYSPSGGFTYGDFGSAGQVIATAAQVYGLNPQVLLVTLEKEQSLVTGRNSSTYCYGTEHKYAAATGYGCPDSGGSYSWYGISLYRRHGAERTNVEGTCVNSAVKAGFSQQVIRAAWLLKFGQQRSLGNVGWAVITGSWDNSDDLRSCYGGPMTQGNFKVCPNGPTTYYDGWRTIDGQATHMDTGATAALYWYTPHFNGNQNFYNLFTSWFGSVYGTPSNLNLKFENLDGGTAPVSGMGGQVGNYAKTITIDNSVHVFYYDIANGNLKHGWTDNGWNFEIVDGEGGNNGKLNADVGGMSYPIVFNNKLYVAYRDFTNGDLRLAVKNGSTWNAQTIDGDSGMDGRIPAGVAWDISIAVHDGGMHIFYSNVDNGDLRHAWSADAATWFYELLDGQPGAISGWDGNTGQGVTGMFINGDLHLLYYEGNEGDLRHAYYNGGWIFEALDGNPRGISKLNINTGVSPSFVYWQNAVHAFYRDVDRGILRHAWADNTGWHFEDLDGAPFALSRYVGDLGLYTEIVTQGNTINIFTYDAKTRGIRQAWYNPSGWGFTNIDGAPDAISGVNSPLGVRFGAGLFGSDVQLYYFDAQNRSLKHAFGPPTF